MPDPILASRTIVIPLIRTPDRCKANAVPLDYKLWPVDRRALIDDLWALALAGLPELAHFEDEVNQRAKLTGRNLEPWRALLGVALWLDEAGLSGLWQRMEGISVAYQKERPQLEYNDFTLLTIQALIAKCATLATSASDKEIPSHFEVTSEGIKNEAITIVNNDDLEFDTSKISSTRVGRVLGKMRLKEIPRPGGKGSRKWGVSIGDLDRWAVTYGLGLPGILQYSTLEPDTLPMSGSSGKSGTNGMMEKPGVEPEDEDEDEFELPPPLSESEMQAAAEDWYRTVLATRGGLGPHDPGDDPLIAASRALKG